MSKLWGQPADVLGTWTVLCKKEDFCGQYFITVRTKQKPPCPQEQSRTYEKTSAAHALFSGICAFHILCYAAFAKANRRENRKANRCLSQGGGRMGAAMGL